MSKSTDSIAKVNIKKHVKLDGFDSGIVPLLMMFYLFG